MPSALAEPFSFYWHDYETFGRVPRSDRPAQFAGVRTDADLNEIEPPLTLYCQPAPDSLPDPEACLLTGITPDVALQHGVPEPAFAQQVVGALSRPGTVGVGYNSLTFDDEVTRFLLWRNLIDPYAREWQNGCGRWDLLDVVRACFALRPEKLQWPRHDDGRPSFKLEHLTRANGIEHADAHDALADVRATLALARAVRAAQPRLWDFALKLRHKRAVIDEIAGAQAQGEPIIHVSGRYGAERGCLALVWPLAPHPNLKNELIVWDLSHDPAALFALDAATIRQRLFSPAESLPEGVARLPIKTIRLNRAPFVVGNLKSLTPAVVQRWHLDVDQARRHAAVAADKAGSMAGIWPEVFTPAARAVVDVDEDLYGGFVNDADRRRLQRLCASSPDAWGTGVPHFDDERLDELVFRYRARNAPQSLDDEGQRRWQAHRVARLVRGASRARSLAPYFESLDALEAAQASREPAARDRASAILSSLRAYGARIAP